jgi:hypothetical protein
MAYNPIDTHFINAELGELFKNLPKECNNPVLRKLKQRFTMEMKTNGRFKERLSVGKKMEILCIYGGFDIIKNLNKK